MTLQFSTMPLFPIADSTSVDQIANFNDMNSRFPIKIARQLESWKVSLEQFLTIFYKMDTSNSPSIAVSIKIFENLHVQAFTGNGKIERKFLEPFLNSECIVMSWSQLENLLDFFGSEAIVSLNHNADYYISEALSNLCLCLDKISLKDDSIDFGEKVKFLINQIGLLRCKTYTSHTVDAAFSIYIKSSSCYRQIRKMGVLSLPDEFELLQLIGELQ